MFNNNNQYNPLQDLQMNAGQYQFNNGNQFIPLGGYQAPQVQSSVWQLQQPVASSNAIQPLNMLPPSSPSLAQTAIPTPEFRGISNGSMSGYNGSMGMNTASARQTTKFDNWMAEAGKPKPAGNSFFGDMSGMDITGAAVGTGLAAWGLYNQHEELGIQKDNLAFNREQQADMVAQRQRIQDNMAKVGQLGATK
jgi:hypothetical protein